MSSIKSRATFTAKEIRHLERHVLSLESAWIPKAKAAWLASMSLNHVAEEAAHCVRQLCVGAAMDRPRPRTEAFWARCLEEALGFFGSRLVNPKRRCTTIAEWTWHFENGRGLNRQVAAFTLALTAALRDNHEGAQQLIPGRGDSLFHAVSHALGYLLGHALATAFSQGTLAQSEVRELFRDPWQDPVHRFVELTRRFDAFGHRQRRN
jgi:hypothetical protein